MATNPIKSNEVIQDNLFKNTIESGIMLIQVSEQILSKFKEIAAETKGGIGGVKPNSYEGIKKLGEETQKVNVIYDEAAKVAKRRIEYQKQIDEGLSRELRELHELEIAAKAKIKSDKDDVKLTSDQTDAYEKLEIRLRQAQKAYRDLAAQELQNTDTAKKFKSEIDTLDTKLKGIDASMGKYGRNVGNYASATNGLRLSVGQIARELPSLSNGFAIFASAIGNNVAAVSDSIQQFRIQQAALKAEGKATQSILSALGSSIFSFNTALMLGVTLFTIFGKEIGEWGRNLFKSADALELTKKAQKELTKAQEDATKSAIEENTHLTLLLATAKSHTVSIEQRKLAVDELQKTYPNYFKNLSDEEIMAGNTAKAELELRDAILAKAKVQAASAGITANETAKLELQKELEEANLELKKKQAIYNQASSALKNDRSGREAVIEREQSARRALNAAINEKKAVETQIQAVDLANKKLLDLAIENQGKSIKLTVDPEKDAAGKKGKTPEQLAKSREDALLKDLELIHQVKSAEIEATMSGNKEKIALINESLRYELEINAIKVKDYEKMLKLQIAATIKADDEIAEILKNRTKEDEIGLIDGTKAREDAAKSQAAANKKRQSAEDKDKQNLLTKSLQGLQRQLDAENQLKIDAINKDIQANQKRQDLLRSIAAEGAQDAQNNLAFELRRQAELESKREKQIKKQIRQEQTLAILKAFASGDTRNANAIKNLGIASFFEGTEDTGTVNSPLDANGGRLAVLHDNERVLTKEQNKKAGGLTNDEAANVLNAYNLGQLINPTQFDRMPMSSYVNDERQINALQEVKNEIRDLKQIVKNRPVQRTEFDEVEKLVRHIVVTEYKKEITSRKTGGLHGR